MWKSWRPPRYAARSPRGSPPRPANTRGASHEIGFCDNRRRTLARRQSMRPRAMQVYRVKIVLQGVDPPIWRRVDIAGDITLRKLHGIVQAAMGWGNAHQHLFIAGQGEYGVTYPDFSSTISDERRATLAGMADRKSTRLNS